jgi:predicted nucleic acid-binding protein
MKRLRIYADTSVFGGCFDEEFADESNRLFEDIEKGKFLLVVSRTTFRELAGAPENVRNVLSQLSSSHVEVVEASAEIDVLRDAYLKAGVVGEASKIDAEHIATASIANVDFVVSWNFKHMVHYEKIHGYHAVNLLHGYKAIEIYSPREVVSL